MLTTDGTFRRTYVYGRTREQVHIRLVELQDRSARGIPRADHVWKVGEYLDYWLENIARQAARPSTYAKYETITRLYLRPGLGRYRLDRLSVAVVQSWLNSRLAAGDSIAKVHVVRTVLGSALTRAMREELISRNVARLATLPPDRPVRQQPWSPAEARAFLQAARGDGLYPAFVLLLVYGLRRGEVLGLSWHDVDMEHGVLRIHQQLLRARGRLQLGPVKTNAGRRDLPLLGVARSVLLHHAELKVLGSALHEWTAHDLVFTTRTGRPVEPRNLARSFHRIIASYGLRRSVCIACGVPRPPCSRILASRPGTRWRSSAMPGSPSRWRSTPGPTTQADARRSPSSARFSESTRTDRCCHFCCQTAEWPVRCPKI